MYVNYYDYDKNSKEHKPFLNSLKSMCEKYDITPVPEVSSYGVEDATCAIYITDNGLHLNWGCPWCEESNEEEIKLYATLDKEAWLDHVNPFRNEEEESRKEIQNLKALPKDELLKKIQEQKEKVNDIEQECKTTTSYNAKIGLSMKIMFERLNLSKLEEILNI